MRKRLSDSWKQYDVWATLEPAERATPLSRRLALALAGVAFEHEEISFAVGVLVGFQALLRTTEILNILKQDVIFDEAKGIAIIDLGMTKSGKRRNEKESVMISDVRLVALLLIALQGKKPGDRLCPSETTFRRRFADFIRILGVSEHRFMPYSIRRGGATDLFLESGSMETVRCRGRWVSLKTAKIYVDECVAAAKDIAFSQKQSMTIDRYAEVTKVLLS